MQIDDDKQKPNDADLHTLDKSKVESHEVTIDLLDGIDPDEVAAILRTATIFSEIESWKHDPKL